MKRKCIYIADSYQHVLIITHGKLRMIQDYGNPNLQEECLIVVHETITIMSHSARKTVK